jgi:catechol 2,3-dioxygenase-like lactoylglutathione lyase family enzyme
LPGIYELGSVDVRILTAVLGALLLASSAATVTGLDHVPIAVSDLARAAADYRALGFALKPGRSHDDGIQNQHVKFTDGTELELITAPAARDALTRTYRQHLAQGDGPAFFALFAPDMTAADARLAQLRIPHARDAGAIDFPQDPALGYLFLSGRNASPTDRPEHFAHVNTAESLVRVWLAGDDLSRERELLDGLGAAVADADVRVPDAMHASVARLQEGEVILLPGSRQLVAGRRVVGATLRVGDLAAARAILDRGQPTPLAIVTTRNSRSVFVPPSRTHGLWLEFLEPLRRPS